jgi:hypothetical protein
MRCIKERINKTFEKGRARTGKKKRAGIGGGDVVHRPSEAVGICGGGGAVSSTAFYCRFLLSFFLLPLLQFIRSVPNLNLGGGPSRERETEVEVYREI